MFDPITYILAQRRARNLSAPLAFSDPSGNIDAVTVQTALTELGEEKANKASTPTAGHIATLDSTGSPTDSGFALSAYANAREISGAYEGVNLETAFASEIAGYADVWAWIKARVQAENFVGLHPHDYIQVTCTNPGAYVLKPEIAGINTYKGSGGTEIPSHIDWLTKDCWPDTVTYNPVNYNNGIGMDKFTATAGQTEFQLTYRGAAYPASLSSVTKNGTATTDYTYAAETGILTYTGAALSEGDVIKAIWTTPVSVPFLASNLNAYMNSLKMGVPNEAALDPFLTEVDYTAGGIYYFLPAALKAVITKKRMYAATRYTAGSLLTASGNYTDVEIGPLWVPEEMEVYGSPMYATAQYDKWYARMYPAFAGGNRKKGAGNGGTRATWWLLASSGISTPFCGVSSSGLAYNYTASSAFRAPVGFRIQRT